MADDAATYGVPMEDVLRHMIDEYYGPGNADLIVPESPRWNVILPPQYEKPVRIEQAMADLAWQIYWLIDVTYPPPKGRPTFTLVKGTGPKAADWTL